jgi:hypothetical protein
MCCYSVTAAFPYRKIYEMSDIFNTYVILKMTNYKYAKTDIFIALQTYGPNNCSGIWYPLIDYFYGSSVTSMWEKNGRRPE